MHFPEPLPLAAAAAAAAAAGPASAPMLLNKDTAIDAATFQELWSAPSPDLTLAAAVTATTANSDSGNFYSLLLLHLETAGVAVVAQSIVPGGMRLFLHAAAHRLPLTAPVHRTVPCLAELLVIRSASDDYWLLTLHAKCAQSQFLEEFVHSLRLREVVQAHDDGSRGRGRALALLGLDYF